MIKDKKIIGVCITGIHNNARIAYLKQLYNYAQKNGYKLIVFNSFSEDKNHSPFHNDAGAVYRLINFELIDMLVIHEQSFSDTDLAVSLRREAEVHGVSLLPEELFFSDSISANGFQSAQTDTLPDSVIGLHHVMKDSLFHEDFMYEWLSRILSIKNVKELKVVKN